MLDVTRDDGRVRVGSQKGNVLLTLSSFHTVHQILPTEILVRLHHHHHHHQSSLLTMDRYSNFVARSNDALKVNST